MSDFALIGAAGFVASRHMKAIKETGNNLVAALDKSDSVGVLDGYFPQAAFFTEFERFDRHLEKLRRNGRPVDFLSVCSPNYLHDAHIRFGLRHGAAVICEKPVVLNPWNVEPLLRLQEETGKSVYQILQLRLHPHLMALKEQVTSADPAKTFDVDLTYITARGKWYYASWKGDESKSGGVATNIGIHLFDALLWIFGAVRENVVHVHTHDRAAGFLHLDRARVRWFLSINEETLPEGARRKGSRTYRSIKVQGEELEFSDGFADLHTKSYSRLLSGEGFGIAEALPSVELTHIIRTQRPVGARGDFHSLAELPLQPHPFGS